MPTNEVWNIACGAAQNKAQLIIFRFLAGLGGSAPLAVSISSIPLDLFSYKNCQIGGGVLGDCWHAEQRGQAIALYSLAPLLGPVIGPVAGAWISMRTTWRWVVRSQISLLIISLRFCDISSGQPRS